MRKTFQDYVRPRPDDRLARRQLAGRPLQPGNRTPIARRPYLEQHARRPPLLLIAARKRG